MSSTDNTYMRLIAIGCQTGLPNSGAENPEAVPMFVMAPPGVGKTEGLMHVGDVIARGRGFKFPVEVIAIPQATPEQIGGLPVPDESKRTTSLYPMSAGKLLIEEGRGIFFFDELTSGSEQTAAACLTLIQSGRFGDAVLPPSVARIAAGNLPDRAANGRALTAPESNRFCFIDWPSPMQFADAWIDYMRGGLGMFKGLDNVLLPDNWEVDNYPRAAGIVTTYIQRHTQDLHREPDSSDATKAWPSPRSWRNATRLLAACLSLGERETSQLAYAALAGCVGKATAENFHNWLVQQDLMDPEEALAPGNTWQFTKEDVGRPDRLILTAEAICFAANRKNHPEFIRRWTRAADIIDNLNHAATVSRCGEILATAGVKLSDLGGKLPKFYQKYNKMNQAVNKTEISIRMNGKPSNA